MSEEKKLPEAIRAKIMDYAKSCSHDGMYNPATFDGAEFGYQLAQEELNKAFREGVEQGYRQATSKEPYNEPTQDELWEEAIEKYAENTEEAKKRYRITRI